jgi:hypothetical protein
VITRDDLSRLPSWAKEALDWPFDFDVEASSLSMEPWFVTASGESFEPVAAQGAGGIYGLLAPRSSDGPLAFVSSEGQAGVIAPSLAAGLSLILTAPYWFDLAKFSGNGQLSEMRRALPYLEIEIAEDMPQARELGARLLAHFGLRPLPDPPRALYESMAMPLHLFLSSGEELDSLYNRFTVDDNPQWRGSG